MRSCAALRMDAPPAATMMSPFWIPTCSAGEPRLTSAITAPSIISAGASDRRATVAAAGKSAAKAAAADRRAAKPTTAADRRAAKATTAADRRAAKTTPASAHPQAAAAPAALGRRGLIYTLPWRSMKLHRSSIWQNEPNFNFP